jgi:hypothetical protein
MPAIVDVPVPLIYRDKPIAPDEWKILKLVEYWQFFITPTWKALGTKSGRIQTLNNWLRWVAHQGNTTKRYLIYVVRWELGEIGGRPHCHLFVGGMKDVTNFISMAWILQADWRKRHGHCDVRVFDRGHLLRAANYVGGDSPWWRKNDLEWGKNRYEIGKFGSAGDYNVHFSRRADEVLLQMREGSAARSGVCD